MRKEEDIEDGPTPEQIKYLLQQSILRNYPNPERKGCLDSAMITAIAQQRLPHEDSSWKHISHCSPCYREFLDCRKQFRQEKAQISQSRQRRTRLALLIAVAMIGLLAITILKNH